MERSRLRPGKTVLALLGFTALVVLPTGWARPTQDKKPTISTVDEIKEDALNAPCKKNSERREAAIALFKKMGAPDSAVTVEKVGGVENVVVTIPGSGEGKLVVGAHYDKVADGCGAVDNWTGIVTIAHLYRSRASVAPVKTFVFVAFGREEEGLLGSKAMTGAIKKKDVPSFCAMINIDSLGMSRPQVADNMTSPGLLKRAADTAQRMKVPFSHARIPGGDSDSSSFLAKGIPAITIHGLTSDWQHVLHSSRDTVQRIVPESVYLGYELALNMIWDLDAAPCNASR